MALAVEGIALEVALNFGPFEASPTWTDLTTRCDLITISGGRTSPFGPFNPRVLTARIDDSDGTYDVMGSAGLVAGTPVRVTLTANGSDYRRFYGFVDDDKSGYDYPSVGWLTFRATDGQKYLAREQMIDISSAPSENTDVRFGRILDEVSWPTGAAWRSIDAGSVLVNSGDVTGNALAALNAVVVTEGAVAGWWIDREGVLRFDNRGAPAEPWMTDTQFTISNDQATIDGGAAPATSDMFPERTDQDIYNSARTTDGTTDATASDSTSIDDHGPLPFPDRTMDTPTTSYLQDEADLIVDVWKDQDPYVREVSFDILEDGALLEEFAQLDWRAKVRTVHQRLGGAGLGENFGHVAKMTEQYVPGQPLRASVLLSNAAGLAAAIGGALDTTLELDSGTRGLLDTNTLSP